MKYFKSFIFALLIAIPVATALDQSTTPEDLSITSEEYSYLDSSSLNLSSEEYADSSSKKNIPLQPRQFSYQSSLDAEKYIITMNKLNWHAAYVFCEQNGWRLLRLETPLEQFEVQNYINFFNLQGHDFWTSGNNFQDIRSFRWDIEGPEFKYTNWAFGEPDNYRSGDTCVKLQKNSLQWVDDSCENPYHFICQRNDTQMQTNAYMGHLN